MNWENPTLVGELVTLRPAGAADATPAWEMVNDAEGNDLSATTATFTYEQIEQFYASRHEHTDRIDTAIIENATGRWAGEAVLNEYDPEQNSANFRISLRGPAWYGRGLGTEATRLIVEYGLRTLGLDKVTLSVLARNPRARRTYEKAGFVTTGEFNEDDERWIEMERRPSSPKPAPTPGSLTRTREVRWGR